MNLDQKLLVCEAMLARLDEACASAEAEVKHADALEQHIRRLLAHLEAEQSRLDEKIREVAAEQDGVGAPEQDEPLADMEQLMSRLRGVQARLAILVQPRDAALYAIPHPGAWGAETSSLGAG
jgi:hypothetical protein